jgi:radical SAM superfamily enzyme YgiQ (UPF0313 family)
MKKAGCHSIRIGLESTDPQILKNIGKNITKEDVRRTVYFIKKEGMEILLYLILGLPGETKRTMAETLKFAKSINVDYITLGIAQPYPGTPFYDYLSKNNYLKTRDWSLYDPMKAPVYEYPNLSSRDILQVHYSGLRSFYLRPAYILKKLLKIRSFQDFSVLFKNGMGFISRYVFGKR